MGSLSGDAAAEASALRALVRRLEAAPDGSPARLAELARARDDGWNADALLELLLECRLAPEERARAAADLDRYRVLVGHETADEAAERVLRAASLTPAGA